MANPGALEMMIRRLRQVVQAVCNCRPGIAELYHWYVVYCHVSLAYQQPVANGVLYHHSCSVMHCRSDNRVLSYPHCSFAFALMLALIEAEAGNVCHRRDRRDCGLYIDSLFRNKN